MIAKTKNQALATLLILSIGLGIGFIPFSDVVLKTQLQRMTGDPDINCSKMQKKDLIPVCEDTKQIMYNIVRPVTIPIMSILFFVFSYKLIDWDYYNEVGVKK